MWNDLTMSERADVIKMAVKAGLRDMKSIKKFYDDSLKYAEGGPKVTLVDNDKVRMSPSGTFSDDNGNIIGDSVVLPEITIRARDDKKHVGEYKSTFNPSGAAEFAGTVLNSPLMLADKGINKLGINGTPVQTTAQRLGETFSPTRWIGTVKSGFKESPWSENNPGLWGDRNIDIMTDLAVGVGLSKVPYSKIATNVSNAANSYKYLKAIEKAPINSDKLLNDAMLNDLNFVNGAIRNKSALAPKTVEDVVSFTYGLPKGINPKTKLSRLTSNQIYDLVLRDLQRENPNNWFIGVGNSAKNNRYIHMDANSSIIPTTEGFLPTREGFTKVGRYGTPEIWYNKDIPYYPRELSSTPRTVVTTKKALGIEDAFDNVAHTPKTLKYEDILYGLEPNEFGSYNKVLYVPYKKAPLSNTPYNPSIDPNNLFNIQQSLARTKSLEELIPRYNEFAKFYDYDIVPEGTSIAEAEKIIKQNLDRHNTFYRGLSMPKKEEVAAIRKIIGKDATDKQVMDYLAKSGSRDPYNTYVSVDERAGQYAKDANVAILKRKYKLGENPKTWLEDADFVYDTTPATGIPKKGVINYPWASKSMIEKAPPSELRLHPDDYTFEGWLPVKEWEYGKYVPTEEFKGSNNLYFNEAAGHHKPNFAEGGSIHIAPSKRGTFTAAATKHGMGVQEFASKVLANKDNYSSAMVKKANFAKNASKWKHGLGGYLFI